MTIDRQRVPEPGPSADFRFPDWKEYTLKNGLTVVLLTDPTFPHVSFRIMMSTGGNHDDGLPGLTSVVADLLSRGTSALTASEVAEKTEFMGGRLSSGSQWDSSWIGITALSTYSADALKLLADSVMDPGFRQEDIDFLVEQRKNQFLMNMDSTSWLAGYAMSLALFPKHLYEFPVSGTTWSLEKINRHRILEHYQNRFQATGSLLIAIGDFDPETLLPGIEKHFSHWKPHALEPETLPVLPLINKRKIWVVDKPDAVQSSIRIAHHGISKSNPDLPAVMVMNTILGGYFGSRLNLNLREDKGFTYGVRSAFSERRYPGFFTVVTDVRTEVTGESVHEIIREMARLQREPVDTPTLDNVKNYMTGRFPSDFETNDQIAQAIMEIRLYNLNASYFSSLRNQIAKITREQVLDAARKYLNPQKASIIVAGNAADVTGQISSWGQVQVIDPQQWQKGPQ
ncbi:MAG: insulinase family protein [Bacteroidetes bacterium]|nr:insulinase family protein [Bacteroidota bacterium]